MDYEIELACGRLNLRTVREDLPLPSLLDFASRQNPRRGFLFVSRVLGKHIPCAPRRMRESYDRLARALQGEPGPLLAIGLAETATGLGAGVADSLAGALGRTDVLFQHTTRHWIDAPVLLRFDEVHSHAPEHILYAPDPALAERYRATATLALIDDEISTGRTLARIAERLAPHLPSLRRILFVSLVNWLDSEARERIAASLEVPIRFVSLIDGTFSFAPRSGFSPTLPSGVIARQPAPWPARSDTGRRGLAMPPDRTGIERAAEALSKTPRLQRAATLIGTGELAYPPFLVAEELERQGLDVLFQGTTRSPILAGGAIAGSLSISDEHAEGVENYLHNPPAAARHTIVAYESSQQAVAHDLPHRLGAERWVVPSDLFSAPQYTR